MGNQDPKIDIKRLITILRKITLSIQIAPFIYSAIYIVVLFWEIIFFFDFDADDKERIIHALVGAGAPVSIVSRVSRSIDDGKLNEGFTYSNPKLRQSVVGIGKTSSGPEFMNSTVHEIVHLAQDIAIAYKISLGGEEIAYLAGDISRSISEVVCELSCPHCRLQ